MFNFCVCLCIIKWNNDHNHRETMVKKLIESGHAQHLGPQFPTYINHLPTFRTSVPLTASHFLQTSAPQQKHFTTYSRKQQALATTVWRLINFNSRYINKHIHYLLNWHCSVFLTLHLFFKFSPLSIWSTLDYLISFYPH